MFCEKTKHRKCNKLIKVESDKFWEKIEKIYNEKGDHGLRVKIGGDFSKLLLLKAHCHKNVMLRMSNLLNLKVMMRIVYMTRHLKTLQRICEKIMKGGKALRMDTAFQKYQQNLTDAGVKDEDAARCTNAKLKARILERFGNSIRFADQKHKNEPQVVYSSDVDIKELINFANEYKKALDDESLVEQDDNTMQE